MTAHAGHDVYYLSLGTRKTVGPYKYKDRLSFAKFPL